MPAPGVPNNPGGANGGPPGASAPPRRGTANSPAQAMASLPDAQYGEAATYRDLQQQAPLARQATPNGGSAGLMGQSNPMLRHVVPFGAETQRPDEPVTAGAARGPGPGPVNQVAEANHADLGNLVKILPVLEMQANMPNANPTTRLLVNYIRANQGAPPPGTGTATSPVPGR